MVNSVMTREQAAAVLQCSEKTVDRLRKNGDLTWVRVGRSIRIHQSSVRALLGAGQGAHAA